MYGMVSSTFGQGSGPIFFERFRCDGLESSLLSCPKNLFIGSYCTHDHDVGVRCERKYELACESIMYIT